MADVLLVDDDETIRGLLAQALAREGYEVRGVATGREALEQIEVPVDLMIMDPDLADMDGLDIVRTARASLKTFPILILTDLSEELDVVVGLDAGADDYVTKPFRLAELTARVRALLRRMSAVQSGSVLKARDITVDLAAHRAYMGERELQLTGKEFDLLRVLVSEAGNVVSRETLMQEVWGNSPDSSTKKLDMQISWLRRKLDDHVSEPRYITTIRGKGFRFEQ